LIHKQEVLLTRDGGKLDIEECTISALVRLPYRNAKKALLFDTGETVWISRDFPCFCEFFFLDEEEHRTTSFISLIYLFFSLIHHSQVQQDTPGQEGALSSSSDSNGRDGRQKPSFCLLVCSVPYSLILALVHIHRQEYRPANDKQREWKPEPWSKLSCHCLNRTRRKRPDPMLSE